MRPASRPAHPGLQNERTRLAWQRTTLSGLTCSLLVARLLAPRSVALAVVVGLAAVASSLVLARFSSRRYRARADPGGRRPAGDGGPYLAVTGLLLVTAVGALAYLLVR